MEQQVKMMQTDQMGVKDGRGRVSRILHLSMRAEEQALTHTDCIAVCLTSVFEISNKIFTLLFR